MSHRAWSKLQHALHDNGVANRQPQQATPKETTARILAILEFVGIDKRQQTYDRLRDADKHRMSRIYRLGAKEALTTINAWILEEAPPPTTTKTEPRQTRQADSQPNRQTDEEGFQPSAQAKKKKQKKEKEEKKKTQEDGELDPADWKTPVHKGIPNIGDEGLYIVTLDELHTVIEQKRFEGHTQAKPLAILLARPMEQIPPETCNLVIQHQLYPHIAQIDAPLLVKGRRTARACHLWQLGDQAVERKEGSMPVKMAWTESSVQPVREMNVLEAHCPAKLFSKLVGLLDQATKARATRAEKGGKHVFPQYPLGGYWIPN